MARNSYRGVEVKTPSKNYGRLSTSELVAQRMARSGTLGNVQLYVNADTGNDSYSGLTPDFAIKSLNALERILPEGFSGTVVVNLRGNFYGTPLVVTGSTSTYTTVGVLGVIGCNIYFDGGTDTVTVAGPYTADTYSNIAVGTSSLSMTNDEYAGYFLKITSGALAGYTRMIRSNNSKLFTLNSYLTTSPGACTYEIVRPATSFLDTGSGSYPTHRVTIMGEGFRATGNNSLYLQNIYFACDSLLIDIDGNFEINGCILKNASISRLYSTQLVVVGGTLRNVDKAFLETYSPATNITPAAAITTTNWGYNILGTSSIIGAGINYFKGSAVNCVGLLCKPSTSFLYGSSYQSALYGSKFFKTVALTNYVVNTSTAYASSIPYKNSFSSTSGAGLTLTNKSLFTAVTNSTEFVNCAAHGITLQKDSHVQFDGTVTSSGITGAGMYLINNSSCFITAASPPTLSGTVGDFSINGSAQASTWATVAGGTHYWSEAKRVTVGIK